MHDTISLVDEFFKRLAVMRACWCDDDFEDEFVAHIDFAVISLAVVRFVILLCPARVEAFVRPDLRIIHQWLGHFTCLDQGVVFEALALLGHFGNVGVKNHVFIFVTASP
jgi:hypothetical protein